MHRQVDIVYLKLSTYANHVTTNLRDEPKEYDQRPIGRASYQFTLDLAVYMSRTNLTVK